METKKSLCSSSKENWSRRCPYYHKCPFPSVSFRNVTSHEPDYFVRLLRALGEASQAGWGVPLEVVGLVPRGDQLRVELRENSRAIRRRNGRISIPWGQRALSGVESERRELEWEWRAAETSWRKNGCDHWNCTEQTLVQPQPLQRIFLPFIKEIWGQSLPGIALRCSLLLPSFLFREILFLAANDAEGVGKRNPKQQQKNPTSAPGNTTRQQLFEMSSWRKSLLHSTSTDLPSTQQSSEVSPAEMIQNVCRHRSCSYRHNEINYSYIIIES